MRSWSEITRALNIFQDKEGLFSNKQVLPQSPAVLHHCCNLLFSIIYVVLLLLLFIQVVLTGTWTALTVRVMDSNSQMNTGVLSLCNLFLTYNKCIYKPFFLQKYLHN